MNEKPSVTLAPTALAPTPNSIIGVFNANLQGTGSTIVDPERHVESVSLTLAVVAGASDTNLDSNEAIYLDTAFIDALDILGFDVDFTATPTTQTLTITSRIGGVSPAQLEGILENVKYANADTTFSFNPNDRVVTVTVTDDGGTVIYDGGLTSDPQSLTIDLAANVTDWNNVNLFTGSNRNDTIRGLGGNDVLDGAGGNDTLEGGSGDDTLTGGTGNDILDGGTNNDRLTGGTGNDTLRVDRARTRRSIRQCRGLCLHLWHARQRLHHQLRDRHRHQRGRRGRRCRHAHQRGEDRVRRWHHPRSLSAHPALQWLDPGRHLLHHRSRHRGLGGGYTILVSGNGGPAAVDYDPLLREDIEIPHALTLKALGPITVASITVNGSGGNIVIDNVDVSTTGDYGVYVDPTADYASITFKNGDVTGGVLNGFAVNVADIDAVTIENATFSNNGTNPPADGRRGEGAILFEKFNGNVTLAGVTVNGPGAGRRNGIQIRGDYPGSAIAAGGTITLTNVSVSGAFSSTGIAIRDYTSLNGSCDQHRGCQRLGARPMPASTSTMSAATPSTSRTLPLRCCPSRMAAIRSSATSSSTA